MAERELGGLDVVIHSAAALAYGRFEDVPSDVFHTAVETTVGGTVNVARAALNHFRAHGERGSLIVVGSLLGKIATPFMSTYVTSKWAVHGLVRTLQIEARETPGISISLVSPGGVDTPVYRQAGSYLGVHGRPPPPVSSPERVAAAVVRAIDQPAREASVGSLNSLVVLGFRALPGSSTASSRRSCGVAACPESESRRRRATSSHPIRAGREFTADGRDAHAAAPSSRKGQHS